MNLHRRLSGTTLFIAAVFVLCLATLLGLSPSAKADTFQYVFTDPSTTTNIVFTVTEATLQPSGDVTSFTSATSTLGAITAFAWDSASGGSCLGGSSVGLGCAAYRIGPIQTFGFAYSPGSFLSPGTYADLSGTGTLDITDLSTVGAPEPSTLLLLGCGLFGLPVVASFGSRIRNLGR